MINPMAEGMVSSMTSLMACERAPRNSALLPTAALREINGRVTVATATPKIPSGNCINRNAMFAGGLRPHMYCLPVAKREVHRHALRRAATSGSPAFFLGTDSAPHPVAAKEAACGCAGIYTAHAGIELYAEIFGAYGALDKLEGFASVHGANFYGLPRNPGKITLVKETWDVPAQLTYHKDTLVPFRAGGTVGWRVV